MADPIRPDVQAFLADLNSVPGPGMHEMGALAAQAMMIAEAEADRVMRQAAQAA